MGRTAAILLAAVTWLVAGCPGGTDGYYPLEAGRSWSYRMTVRQGEVGSERVMEATSVVTNLAEREFAGMRVVPQRQEAFGTARVRLLRDDGESVVEVGELNEADGSMMAKDPFNPIIRRPLTNGASWAATWETMQSGTRTLLPMRKTVTTTDGVLEVAAGRFTGCLRLAIAGGGPVIIDGTRTDVAVAGEEWFAPGVGLVRATFQETVADRAGAATRVEVDLIESRP